MDVIYASAIVCYLLGTIVEYHIYISTPSHLFILFYSYITRFCYIPVRNHNFVTPLYKYGELLLSISMLSAVIFDGLVVKMDWRKLTIK